MSSRPYIIGALIGSSISVVATKYSNSIDWIDAIGRNVLGSYPFPVGLQAAAIGIAVVHAAQVLRESRVGLERRVESKH